MTEDYNCSVLEHGTL